MAAFVPRVSSRGRPVYQESAVAFLFSKEWAMRFGVVGADKESGNDVEVVLTAPTQADAEAEACKRGILVSAIKQVAEPEGDAIALVDDEPPAQSATGTVAGASVAGSNGSGGSVAGAAANNKTAHGLITVNASAPS